MLSYSRVQTETFKRMSSWIAGSMCEWRRFMCAAHGGYDNDVDTDETTYRWQRFDTVIYILVLCYLLYRLLFAHSGDTVTVSIMMAHKNGVDINPSITLTVTVAVVLHDCLVSACNDTSPPTRQLSINTEICGIWDNREVALLLEYASLSDESFVVLEIEPPSGAASTNKAFV